MITKLMRKLLTPTIREVIKEWEKEGIQITRSPREEMKVPEEEPKVPETVNTMRIGLSVYYQGLEEHVTKNPHSCEIDLENYSDSYKWLSLPIPDESPETVPNMIGADVELYPNDRLAGILLDRLRTELPTGVNLDAMNIDRVENSFRFCISGSTSLEALRNVCVPGQSDCDSLNEKHI